MADKIKYINGSLINGVLFIKEIEPDKHKRNYSRKGVFKCVCGKEFESHIYSVKSGRTKSCGCYKVQSWLARVTKHGEAKNITPEFRCWSGMKDRCYNVNNSNYSDYGGRGITICEKWLNDFNSFLKDMGRKPSPLYSIERVDNNKNYCQENCKWATRKEQGRNRRSNRLLTLHGETRCLIEWCEIYGYTKGLIRNRLKYGYTVEEAFSFPKGIKRTIIARSSAAAM